MRIYPVLLLTLVLTGCAGVSQTVTLSPQQVAKIRDVAKVTPCPPGRTAKALAVELADDGGAVLTVTCQSLEGLFK